MIADKTVSEEGNRVDVYDDPDPAIIEHRRIVRDQPTDKLMQIVDTQAL